MKLFLPGLISALGAAIAISLPVQAEVISQARCVDTENLTPSKALRTAELKQFGIRVRIPANFRTLLRNDGSVSILAPGDFNLIQCLAKGIPVQGTDAMQMETFRVHPNPEGLTLKEFQAQKINAKEAEYTLSESTFDGVAVLLSETQARLGLAQGFYQIDGVEGVVEISTSQLSRLTDLITRLQAINPPQVEESPQPNPEQGQATNFIQLALDAVGLDNESRTETIVREFINANQAVITITREGLQDDSVAGLKYRVTLQRVGNEWTVTAVQRSQKCQPGRGSQTYGNSLCS